MAEKGFIKLHRQIQEHEFYKEPRKFSKFEAWLYILLNAKYEEEIEMCYGQETLIPVGSFATSYTKLSRAWGWDKKAVRKFINYLIQEKMIEITGTKINPKTGTKRGTNINIANWTTYQGDRTKTNPKTAPKTDPKNREPSIIYKEDKNIYTIIFSHWNKQKITVHRTLTEDMKKAIDNALKKHSKEEIMQAISRYSKIYHDKDYYFEYNWTLINFLKQGNALPEFLEDGQKWIAYKKSTIKPETPNPKSNLDPYDLKYSWE